MFTPDDLASNRRAIMDFANRGIAPRMTLNQFALVCRRAAHSWYFDPATGLPIIHNPGERMMLMVTELSESFEARRTDAMDTHLPDRRGEEVEIVDLFIRAFDWSREQAYDLDTVFWGKLAFNATRLDHTSAARALPGGKKF